MDEKKVKLQKKTDQFCKTNSELKMVNQESKELLAKIYVLHKHDVENSIEYDLLLDRSDIWRYYG